MKNKGFVKCGLICLAIGLIGGSYKKGVIDGIQTCAHVIKECDKLINGENTEDEKSVE